MWNEISIGQRKRFLREKDGVTVRVCVRHGIWLTGRLSHYVTASVFIKVVGPGCLAEFPMLDIQDFEPNALGELTIWLRR